MYFVWDIENSLNFSVNANFFRTDASSVYSVGKKQKRDKERLDRKTKTKARSRNRLQKQQKVQSTN